MKQIKKNLDQNDIAKTENKEKFDLGAEIFSWVKIILFAFLFVSLINIFFIRLTAVNGISMNKTLLDGERLVTTNFGGKYEKGDIVAFWRKDDITLIKRVIATEGDTIDIDFSTGEVFLNGEVIDEPYINEITKVDLGFEGPVTVPKNHVFVMGDNRNHSEDSRDSRVGMVDKGNIFGKVLFRLSPFTKF